MNRTLGFGIAGGALALALVGGAIWASPSIEQVSAASLPQATATATVPAGTPQVGAPKQRPGRGQGQFKGGANKGARAVMLLIQATSEVSGITPKDVMAGLKDGQSLAQIAQAHSKTADDVVKAARTKLETQLSQAVSNKRMTQDQADTLLKEFDSNATTLVNKQDLGTQFKQGMRGRGGPGGAGAAGGLVKATADVTGMDVKDVLAALKSGQSLAQIAQAHGKTADDILAKLNEQGQQKLDQQMERAKDLINTPGMGMGQGHKPSTATPTPSTNS